MAKLSWGGSGKRFFETGVDRGVLYLPGQPGVAWDGLTGVQETPVGGTTKSYYLDGVKYLMVSTREEYSATISAFTYPDEFAQCDGSAVFEGGIFMGQQTRKTFGFSYRTRVGNDLAGTDFGYKLHLVYGADAAPSERAHATINDSPEAITLSWEFTTNPVDVGTIGGVEYKPTAHLEIDSTKVDAGALADLEDILYGTVGEDPRLPTPQEVIALFSGTVVEAVPTQPSFDSGTNTITIPSTTGVTYYVDDEPVAAGPVVITQDTLVKARPNAGYKFPAVTDSDWLYEFSE